MTSCNQPDWQFHTDPEKKHKFLMVEMIRLLIALWTNWAFLAFSTSEFGLHRWPVSEMTASAPPPPPHPPRMCAPTVILLCGDLLTRAPPQQEEPPCWHRFATVDSLSCCPFPWFFRIWGLWENRFSCGSRKYEPWACSSGVQEDPLGPPLQLGMIWGHVTGLLAWIFSIRCLQGCLFVVKVGF